MFFDLGPVLEKDEGATQLGATRPRVSERKIFLREGLREDLRKLPKTSERYIRNGD